MTGKQIAAEAVKLLALPYRIPYKDAGEDLHGMDCQGLVEYCLRQLGLKVSWKGSNHMFRDCTWSGTPEDCSKEYGRIPIGALLFILEDDGGEIQRGYLDGLGNAFHVGIYTGQGDGAVHASSSRGYVCASKFKGKTIRNGGWNRIGLLPGIEYGIGGESVDGAGKSVMTAIVNTDGGPLNLRVKAHGALLDRIPDGSTVEVLNRNDGWCKVQWNGFTGYVDTSYLAFDSDSGNGDMIQVSMVELREIYDKLGNLLGLRG